MRLVRSDTLPENTRYPDKGCKLAEACLDCPLPVCKEDDPTLNTRLGKIDRNRDIVKAHGRKVSPVIIAKRFKVSSRTVHRVVQQYRNGYVSPRYKEVVGDADITLQELAELSSFRAPEPLPQLLRGEA